MAVSGYCLKCKKQVEIVDPTPITMEERQACHHGHLSRLWYQDLQDR